VTLFLTEATFQIAPPKSRLEQGASQEPLCAFDSDLKAVIKAWDKLPSSLKAAIVAIVSSSRAG